MTENRPRRSFLEELKRRKVVRVAVVYVVAALAISGAANDILPRLQLPEWTVAFVIVLTILGFPLALVLAWAYEVTPSGVARQDALDEAAGEDAPAGAEAVGNQPPADTEGAGATAAPTQSEEEDSRVAVEAVGRDSVAVLPFANLSAEPTHAFFADGVTEDVLAHLGKVKALRVTSRTSVLRYRNTTKPVREIAAELGVGAVLEGSVRATADRVRVVAQLIDARTDTHLWADTYDRDLEDIFAVQSEVAESVARALEAELSGEELAAMRRPPTDDVAAYSLCLEGMAAFETWEPDRFARSIGLFEAASRIDPAYARAHAGLALLLTVYPVVTLRLPPRYHERLQVAMDRALEIDPSSGHGWMARAYYLSRYEYDWLEGEKAANRAVELEPEDPHILNMRADFAYALGRLDEADAYLDRLESIGQVTPMAEMYRATFETYRAGYGKGDFDLALHRFNALVRKYPAVPMFHVHRGIALLWSGRIGESLEAVETSLRLAPETPLAHGLRGAALRRMGRTEEALAEDRWFEASPDPESADRFCWAIIHFAVGSVDRFFDLLEEGVGNRTSYVLPFVRLIPTYQPLWDHPRFLALMDAIWPGEQKRVLGEYGWRPGVGVGGGS